MFVVVAFFVLLGGLSFAVDMYFDWLWFQEIGKATIFTTTLYAKGSVFSATLFLVFLFLYLNLWYAHRSSWHHPDRNSDSERSNHRLHLSPMNRSGEYWA